MKQKVTFVLPGTPTAWARAGIKNGRFYDQRAQLKVQHRMYLSAILDPIDLSGPFSFTATFYFTYPQYRKHKPNNPIYHSITPDIDNCLKYVLDLLSNGFLYKDDSSCAMICARKMYTFDEPRTEITIEQL